MLGLGAGRSQVQILSPRYEKRPAIAGLFYWPASDFESNRVPSVSCFERREQRAAEYPQSARSPLAFPVVGARDARGLFLVARGTRWHHVLVCQR